MAEGTFVITGDHTAVNPLLQGLVGLLRACCGACCGFASKYVELVETLPAESAAEAAATGRF